MLLPFTGIMIIYHGSKNKNNQKNEPEEDPFPYNTDADELVPGNRSILLI